MATIVGTNGNNSWTVIDPGTFTLDGLGGIDTVDFGIMFPEDFSVQQGPGGQVFVDSISAASGALHATLINIELLTFGNRSRTIDLRTYFTPAGTEINGTPGDDLLTPGLGNDTIQGGAGFDVLSYAGRGSDGPINANLRSGVVAAGSESDGFNNIEGVIGGAGNDVFLGNGGNYNLFVGGDGNDTIDGGAADASNGYNVDIAAWRGNTPVVANLQNQTAAQGPFTDSLIGGIEALFGGSGPDTLTGINQAEARLRGETIRGGGGNDQIDGLGGVDMAEFSGPYANYTVTRPNAASSNITVTDNAGSEGSDSLVNVERLMFSDQGRAFGTRAEELAKVAFALWSPGIVVFPAFFAIGFSFYDNNSYTYDQLVDVAFAVYWPEQGAAFADLLISRQTGTPRTQAELLAVMNNAGGGAVGKRAAFDLMANEPIINNAIAATQLTGLHVGLTAPGWGDLHGLLPSAPGP